MTLNNEILAVSIAIIMINPTHVSTLNLIHHSSIIRSKRIALGFVWVCGHTATASGYRTRARREDRGKESCEEWFQRWDACAKNADVNLDGCRDVEVRAVPGPIYRVVKDGFDVVHSDKAGDASTAVVNF